MAELKIDKEDVHDRKNWRDNVMKRKSNPIGKLTINLVMHSPLNSYLYTLDIGL